MLIYLSPTIQIDLLKHASAPFPLKNPALVTVPLSFAVGVLVSWLAPESEAHGQFPAMEQRVHLGPEWVDEQAGA